MIDRLIVHVGHDKTGTTSLQETFTASADALAAAGLHYRPFDRHLGATAHHSLTEEWRAGSLGAAPGPKWQAFAAAARTGAAPVALISSEGLVKLPHEKAVHALKQCATLARRVDVLIYLRHPVPYACSAVSQGLRLGRTLDDIIAAPPIIRHDKIVQSWRRAHRTAGVGGTVIVRPFRRDIDRSFDLVGDVLSVCGLNVADTALTPIRSTANPGLSALAVHLVDWINRERRREPLSQASLAPFNHLAGPAYVLPSAVQESIRRETRAANDWLHHHYGFRLEAAPLAPTPPCPLGEQELASLAELVLLSSQFAFEVEHSRIGWWFGLRSPYPTRRLHHPVFGALQRVRLLRQFLGPAGRRARTVHKRLIAPLDEHRP